MHGQQNLKKKKKGRPGLVHSNYVSEPLQSSNTYHGHNTLGSIFGSQFFISFNFPLSILLCWSVCVTILHT